MKVNTVKVSWYSDLLRTGRSGNRIPVGARFFSHVHTDARAHPASYSMGTVSFPEVNRPGGGVDYQPHLGRLGLYLYIPSEPSWPVLGQTLPFNR
jgi:hypothetical protein